MLDRGLIVFDLDHTLLKANISFRFGQFLYQQNFFSLWTLLGCLSDYARHQWVGMSLSALHTRTFVRLFNGRALSDLCDHADQFLTESLPSLLSDPVLQRLRKGQKEGKDILILSSSPDFLVREVARHLHVPEGRGTLYQVNSEGKLIAVLHVMDGQAKADNLREVVDRRQLPSSAITVYSDSHLDLPLLRMAGEAIGVRPDGRLRRVCLENGWEIMP